MSRNKLNSRFMVQLVPRLSFLNSLPYVNKLFKQARIEHIWYNRFSDFYAMTRHPTGPWHTCEYIVDSDSWEQIQTVKCYSVTINQWLMMVNEGFVIPLCTVIHFSTANCFTVFHWNASTVLNCSLMLGKLLNKVYCHKSFKGSV